MLIVWKKIRSWSLYLSLRLIILHLLAVLTYY